MQNKRDEYENISIINKPPTPITPNEKIDDDMYMTIISTGGRVCIIQ